MLKSRKVTSIFKRGSKLKYSNYLLISILSNVFKILEIMCNHLHEIVGSNNLSYDPQCGF